MEWWELVLFLLVCIIGGAALYIVLCLSISLYVRQPQTAFTGASISAFPPTKPELPSVTEEQPKSIDPKLMSEVENNLRIGSEPWTGELIHFDTSVWEAQQYEVSQLPANLRNELEEAYTITGLANQVVWLSKEFNHKSRDLDETYRSLRTSVAERLRSIRQHAE